MGRAIPTTLELGGTTYAFRSKFESQVGIWLHAIGVGYTYEENEILYKYKYPNSVLCGSCGERGTSYQTRKYIPDFYLLDYGVFIEAKGKFTPKDRKKLQLCKDNMPNGSKLILIFQRDNWITKEHKSRYSDWAEKNGIQCYINTLPEWLLLDAHKNGTL